MTLFDFEELTAYWAEHPPLHILVAAYLGIGKNKRQRTSSSALPRSGRPAGSDLQSMLTELGPGFGVGDVHAGLAPVVLDFAESRRWTGSMVEAGAAVAAPGAIAKSTPSGSSR